MLNLSHPKYVHTSFELEIGQLEFLVVSKRCFTRRLLQYLIRDGVSAVQFKTGY